jgi:hypothetical protein
MKRIKVVQLKLNSMQIEKNEKNHFINTVLICSYLSIQEKEIKAVLEKQRLDWNNGDMIGYMQGYIKSDSFSIC